MSTINVSKIKSLRKTHNLSLEDVARQLEVATTTYWRMENWGQNCKAAQLQKLAKMYGIEMDELLCEDEVLIAPIIIEAKSIESVLALYELIGKHRKSIVNSAKHLKTIEAAVKASYKITTKKRKS